MATWPWPWPRSASSSISSTALDLPELATDARFADMRSRSRHRRELLPLLAERFVQRTTGEWMERLRGVVPAAPVQSMEAALDIADLQDRAMLAEYEHPRLGRVRSVGPPLFVSGYQPRHQPGPGLGADTEAVLTELGMSEAERDELRRRGAFGQG